MIHSRNNALNAATLLGVRHCRYINELDSIPIGSTDVHIFIDEAGSFTDGGKPISPSVVGALVVPDGKMDFLSKKYDRLRRHLPKERGEVKGRLLNETQVSKVVDLLRRNETIFESVAIDMGLHDRETLERHRNLQARGITSQLTSDHHESYHVKLGQLKAQLERMPMQLYVQSVLMFELINTTIDFASAYYSQRRPEELGNFHWIIDAKDRTITNWEEWWSFCVMPMIQSKTLRTPGMQLDWSDYSHMERFFTDPIDYLDQFKAEPNTAKETLPLDLKMIMTESFRFSSDAEFGLELVDIVTTAVRRAMVGNLQHAGWKDIPSLMIHRKNQALRVITLHERDHSPGYSLPYYPVLEAFIKGGRSMIAPSARRAKS